MTERWNIDARLENWARVYRDSRSRQGVSHTGAVCDRARLPAEGSASTTASSCAIDEKGAKHLEVAMLALPIQHRELLYWCYVRRAVPEVICRKLEIPHKPIGEFVGRLARAKAAIEK